LGHDQHRSYGPRHGFQRWAAPQESFCAFVDAGAGIREVINYDFPTSVQSYVHRIGRTGRAGREGKAVTYFTDDDAPFLKACVVFTSSDGN
jgi:ATP-dependent helicase YprA (DUF1998 family)